MKSIFFITLFNLCFLCNAQAQVGQWTWMKGAQNGTAPSAQGDYGTKGVSAPSNEPPARYQACYWTDSNGNFWLFGGISPAGGANYGFLNDLWKYDIAANQWTWISGFNSGSNVQGVYGPKGVPSISYCPSARGYGANCWTDRQNNLWLIGGYGIDSSGVPTYLNDLWKYNIATNE